MGPERRARWGLRRRSTRRTRPCSAAPPLGLVERLPALKQFFVAEAAGLTGEVPKLLRGERV